MSSQSRYILLGSLIVLILVAGFSFYQSNKVKLSSDTPANIANNISSNVDQVSYNCQPGKTAYEVLEKNGKIEFQGSSFGRMITGINGVKQGNGKYWLYSIDGKEATVSADSYICSGNENIKWELK